MGFLSHGVKVSDNGKLSLVNAAMQAILSGRVNIQGQTYEPQDVAKAAVLYANALIEEIETPALPERPRRW